MNFSEVTEIDGYVNNKKEDDNKAKGSYKRPPIDPEEHSTRSNAHQKIIEDENETSSTSDSKVKSSKHTQDPRCNLDNLIDGEESGSDNYEELLRELEEKQKESHNSIEEYKNEDSGPKSGPVNNDGKESSEGSPCPKKNSFQRLTENQMSKSYTEQKNNKSYLSSNLTSLRDRTNTSSATQRRPEFQQYTIYFFNSPIKLDLNLNVNDTVNGVLRQIIDLYVINETVDQSKLKHKDYTDAYELQMLEDEDDFLPDFSIPPLEKNRIFSSLGISKAVAFIENRHFVAPVHKKTNGKESLFSLLVHQKSKVIVNITSKESDKLNMSLVMNNTETVRDIIKVIALKIKGVGEKYHRLRIAKASDQERLERQGSDFQDNGKLRDGSDGLDFNLPLKKLITEGNSIELEIYTKKFADESEQTKEDILNELDLYEANVEGFEAEQTLYNDVKAYHYEEFKVNKKRPRSTKTVLRFLGIDGYNIYNNLKSRDEPDGTAKGQGFFRVKTNAKHPKRKIEYIKNSKVINNNVFMIEYILDDYGKSKQVEYEAPDIKTALQIVGKINYIKNMNKQQKNSQQALNMPVKQNSRDLSRENQ